MYIIPKRYYMFTVLSALLCASSIYCAINKWWFANVVFCTITIVGNALMLYILCRPPRRTTRIVQSDYDHADLCWAPGCEKPATWWICATCGSMACRDHQVYKNSMVTECFRCTKK